MKINKYLKIIILIITLISQKLSLDFLALNPKLVDNYYSDTLYPLISSSLRFIFGFIPFSVGDIIWMILIFIILYEFYFIIKKRFKPGFSHLVNVLIFINILFFSFYALWGLNYYKSPLKDKLNLSFIDYTTDELIKTTTDKIYKVNYLYDCLIQEGTFESTQLNDMYLKAKETYDVTSVQYSMFEYKNPCIKDSMFSTLMSYMGFTGYLNPITLEAQINTKPYKVGIPFTINHEIAHQIGYASEAEANFVSYIVCVKGGDDLFKYSAYYSFLKHCLSEIYKRDKELFYSTRASLNKGVLQQMKSQYEFWNKYENKAEVVFKKGYNGYLKLNKQANGIKSYSMFVNLVIEYENKNGFLEL
ncbi:MAG: DUF3810 domain-containing protein [Flavobacteriaceae bacterium]|nr:DUF3810 domain-containing protein [Flavobacteriaceae bacterium]